MFFGGLTIAINGFSMVFDFSTIAFNGFRWFRTIGPTMRWFRWIVVVYTDEMKNSFSAVLKLMGTCELRNRDQLGTLGNQNRDPKLQWMKFDA